MGNCCNSKAREEESQNNEMKDGIFPKIDNMEEEEKDDEKQERIEKEEKIEKKEKEIEKLSDKNMIKNTYNFSHNYYQQESIDSDFRNSDQRKSEEIFNYFNDLRMNPQNYLTEGQKHGLQKIISTAAEKAVEGNINNLIKNPYYDLLFDKCVKASPESKEEILKNIDKEDMSSLNKNFSFKNYEKNLYMILGDGKKQGDCVWNLLKENGDILWKDIDYLVITTMTLEDSNNIMCYFLFLSKNKK